MKDTLEQTEQAAAQLLAAGFQQSWEAGAASARNDAEVAHDTSKSNQIESNGMETLAAASITPVSSIFPTTTPIIPGTGAVISPGSSLGGAPRARPRSTASRGPSLPIDASIHPVVRLGWRPLCSVVCNGLRGEFLGGHDRDMFIKCTSAPYAGLPLVDVSLGGCIMTCSQFERAAGRELSKKWKESLHVVGVGEGSRATLLSWLKRRGEHDFGAKVVGQRLWVCWCADADYYLGTIVAFNRDTGKHTIQYSSTLMEELHLPVELISFNAEKPKVPVDDGGGVAAAAANTAAVPAMSAPASHFPMQDGGSQIELTRVGPLWHQGSGVSVTSSFGEELRAQEGVGVGVGGVNNGNAISGTAGRGLRPGNRRPRPLQRGGDHFVTGLPPPKRALSAPAAAILAEAAAAARAIAQEIENPQQVHENHHMQHDDFLGSGGTDGNTGTNSPLTPGMNLPQHAKPFVASPMRQQSPPVAALPAPPTVTWPQDVALAVAWMHCITLSVDKDLQNTVSAATVSISGRFQALLALLRTQPACLEGLFEAMVLRHSHFQNDGALQRQKMAEFIVSTVHEAGIQRDLRPKLPSEPAVGEGGVTERVVAALRSTGTAAAAQIN